MEFLETYVRANLDSSIGARRLEPQPRLGQSFCFKNSGFVSIDTGPGPSEASRRGGHFNLASFQENLPLSFGATERLQMKWRD